MATFRSDSKDSGQRDDGGNAVLVPVVALLANEVRVNCPRCGSPYIVTFGPLEPRGKSIAGFTCTAGDCRYTGTIAR